MSYPAADPKPRHFQIGLVAYGIDGPDPSLVFVRVPSERGRYVLTDRCVVEVACPLCEAVVGEPCRRGIKRLQHGVGTHCRRRDLWQRERLARRRSPQPKVRISADDLLGVQSEPEG